MGCYLGDQKDNTSTLSLKATYDLISEATNLRRRVSETIKGAEEYPEEFSQQARARIEAEKLKARKQLEQRRNQVPWSGGHLPRPADDENLRKFILQVFLVVAQEMCELGLQGLWTVERIRLEAEEYLRKFIIKAYSDEGYDKQGRKLEEMADYYGTIKEGVWWAFKESAEYHQFELELLAVAEQQARGSPQASDEAKATEAAVIADSGRPQSQPGETTGHKDAKHDKEKQRSQASIIGGEVHALIPQCRDGLTRWRKLQVKHPSAEHIWKGELRQQGFSDTEIDVLAASKTPESAACRMVAQKHPEMKLKTVQNHYSVFKDS